MSNIDGMFDYTQKEDLENVQFKSHTPTTWSCPDCYSTWPSRFALVAHQRQHYNVNKDTNNEGLVMTSPNGQIKYLCKGCKKKYTYFNSMMHHQIKCKKYAQWKKDDETKNKKLVEISNGGNGSEINQKESSKEGILSFGSVSLKTTNKKNNNRPPPLKTRFDTLQPIIFSLPLPKVLDSKPAESPLTSPRSAESTSSIPIESPVDIKSPSAELSPIPIESPVDIESPSPIESPGNIKSPLPIESPSPTESSSPIPIESPRDIESPSPTESTSSLELPRPTESISSPELHIPTKYPKTTTKFKSIPLVETLDLQFPSSRDTQFIPFIKSMESKLDTQDYPSSPSPPRRKYKPREKNNFDKIYSTSEIQLPNIIYYVNDDEAGGSLDSKLDWYLKSNNLF